MGHRIACRPREGHGKRREREERGRHPTYTETEGERTENGPYHYLSIPAMVSAAVKQRIR